MQKEFNITLSRDDLNNLLFSLEEARARLLQLQKYVKDWPSDNMHTQILFEKYQTKIDAYETLFVKLHHIRE